MFNIIEHGIINIHAMGLSDIKHLAINALSNEFATIEAAEMIDLSSLDKDKISLFNRSFKLLTFSRFSLRDAKNFVECAESLNDWSRLLLLVPQLTMEADEYLRSKDINFCDAAGNLKINIGGMGFANSNLFASSKDIALSNMMTVAFMKLLLVLLQIENAINMPMRSIARIAGISLGSVQRCVEILKTKGFVFTTRNGRFIKNHKELLQLWVQGFNDVVKPQILAGYAMWRSSDGYKSWESLTLPDNSCWGGEAAAQIIDGYLHAEQISIFTSDAYVKTILELNMVPKKDGDITVYKKFWTEELQPGSHIAPLFVVYAQLMGINDTRCHDAAKRLLNSKGNEKFID